MPKLTSAKEFLLTVFAHRIRQREQFIASFRSPFIDTQEGGGFEYKATGPDDIGLLPPEAFQ